MLNYIIHEDETAYNVGIEDPAYASRLFKKVIGTSFREFFAPQDNK